MFVGHTIYASKFSPCPCFSRQLLLHLDNIRFFFSSFFFTYGLCFFSLTCAARFLDDAFPRGVALRKRITIESIRQGTGAESSVVMLICVQKKGGKRKKKHDTLSVCLSLSLSRRTAATALSSTFVSFRWKLPSLSWKRDVARQGESTRRRAVTITLG